MLGCFVKGECLLVQRFSCFGLVWLLLVCLVLIAFVGSFDSSDYTPYWLYLKWLVYYGLFINFGWYSKFCFITLLYGAIVLLIYVFACLLYCWFSWLWFGVWAFTVDLAWICYYVYCLWSSLFCFCDLSEFVVFCRIVSFVVLWFLVCRLLTFGLLGFTGLILNFVWVAILLFVVYFDEGVFVGTWLHLPASTCSFISGVLVCFIAWLYSRVFGLIVVLSDLVFACLI